MAPCAVVRPARLAACASPRLRSSVIASSMLPFASVSAALHSIMPAPVLSRSCFTCAAEISIVAICLKLPDVGHDVAHVYKESAGSQAGA